MIWFSWLYDVVSVASNWLGFLLQSSELAVCGSLAEIITQPPFAFSTHHYPTRMAWSKSPKWRSLQCVTTIRMRSPNRRLTLLFAFVLHLLISSKTASCSWVSAFQFAAEHCQTNRWAFVQGGRSFAVQIEIELKA